MGASVSNSKGAAMKPIYIEKWIIFHVNTKGDLDFSLYHGEMLPTEKCYRLRVAVPPSLIGGEIMAEVIERGAGSK
jgi:hypothetical protein